MMSCVLAAARSFFTFVASWCSVLEFDNGRSVPLLRDNFYIRTIAIMGARSRDPSYSISTQFTYLYIVWTIRLKASI